MKDLDAFNNLLKPKIVEKQKNNHVIGYTRISSKQQLDNFSLQEQESQIKYYVKRNNLILDKIIGGTYESASGDFTRKEFKKLYDEIKQSKKRPHAIAIKFISRFSRTGAGAISIVQELVEKLGVHLIETSSGLTTETLRERSQIYHKLLEAEEENFERLEKTIPGMKSYLRIGNWLGVAPFGYTTYGPRVVDFSKKREKQEIIINEKGKVLQQAWQWKLFGEKDSEIIKKMGLLGVNISKQRLSDIWRNPFYCGVLINNLLDEAVNGRWPAMITKKEFLRVQQIINPDNGAKYKVDNSNEARPLSRFLICSQCSHQMTGYVVKKKNVHYYKCNVCKGVNLNANTTKRSAQMGLNDTFLKLLKNISLQDEYAEPFKLQLKKLFRYLHSDCKSTLQSQKQLKIELEGKLSKLEEKYLYDDLDIEIYNRHKFKIENDLLQCSSNIAEYEDKLSNHENFIDSAIQVVQNISKYWDYGDLLTKQRIQKVVFPKGLVLNPKDRTYLTKNINSVFRLIPTKSDDKKNPETKKVGENTDLSCQVAGAGLEPTTFGL